MRRLWLIAMMGLVACKGDVRSDGWRCIYSEHDNYRSREVLSRQQSDLCLQRGGVPAFAFQNDGWHQFTIYTRCDFPPVSAQLKGEK